MEKAMIQQIYTILPGLLALAKKPVWADYDEKADVLYISFRRPQGATETTPFNDDVLLRRQDNTVVGLTVLHASRVAKQASD